MKKYTIEKITIGNSKLNNYTNYKEFSPAEISKVNSEIAKFLADNNVQPGEYEGETAKELNYSILEFLGQKLENEIKQYDESLLFYAYQQVELIEGKRENNRIQFGLDASKYTDYDIYQKNVEETRNISQVATSSKLIIETFLKVDPKGKNKINDDSWTYLQALSIVIHETTIICEYIDYDIIPHKLVISDLYMIQDIRGKEIYNHEGFYRSQSKMTVKSSMENLLKQKRKKKVEPKIKTNPFLDKLVYLDESFRVETDFSFRNLINTLTLLHRGDLFDESYFPLSLVTEKELVEYLLHYQEDIINETEIKKILSFISLGFDTYKIDDKLVPTNLLRRKERLNLCPLIHLKSGDYLYGNQMCLGSLNLWRSSIISGDFPCNIDKNSEISKALKEIHNYLDKELEIEAGEIAKKTLGQNNVETNVLNFKRLSRSFPKRPSCGEIDLLTVNVDKKVIFVIDAKNMNERIRPYDMRYEIDTFFDGNKSYIGKLSKKEQFIKENLIEVLNHFNVQDLEGWKVQKAFVVNKIYHSAFVDCEVDFVLLRDLSKYLEDF